MFKTIPGQIGTSLRSSNNALILAELNLPNLLIRVRRRKELRLYLDCIYCLVHLDCLYLLVHKRLHRGNIVVLGFRLHQRKHVNS
jgi:hypothetical protein